MAVLRAYVLRVFASNDGRSVFSLAPFHLMHLFGDAVTAIPGQCCGHCALPRGYRSQPTDRLFIRAARVPVAHACSMGDWQMSRRQSVGRSVADEPRP